MVVDRAADARIEPGRHLVLGGARSGKTRHAIELARSLAAARGQNVTYVATAQAFDEEMEHRIALHQAERPASWATLEAPQRLAEALAEQGTRSILVIDCITLWLSNALLRDFSDATPTAPLPSWDAERSALLQWLNDFRGDVLLVSNEVGAGIVPASPVSRRFQDEQGRINQALAARCERVTLVVAGIAMPIKGPFID
jgi:adenosylcobinamide kinase / adenosylcobinamide-phosphate guanylyltransferase